MALVTGIRKDGTAWVPKFVESINNESCIGCGRCYKACAHSCLNLSEFEDEETDSIKMVMEIEDANNCIGCEACIIACPKNCFTHATMEAA